MPNPARLNAYTDPNITTRGPYDQTITSALPNVAKEANGGPVKVYEVEGTDHEPDNSAVDPLPNAGNAWKPGRDLYANGGGIGQSFLEHP